MGSHRRPARVLTVGHLAIADVMLACCAGLALYGAAVAPDAAADTTPLSFPEQSPEPTAHGGPLAPLSIGMVAPETDVPVVPPVVRATTHRANRPETPREAPSATLRVIATPESTSRAVQSDPVAITGTSEPTVAEPTQAATTTATTTTAATTTRTCHRWRCHTWPTTTSAATTGTTTSATETSDPLATLISDVLEETP